MKKLNLLSIAAFFFSLISIVSCNNDLNLGTNAALTMTATDEAQVASINDEVISTVDEYALTLDNAGYQKVKGVSSIDSVIVTVDNSDPKVFPKVITIDFGTTGIVGKRGNTLKGKIIVTLSNRMALAGSTRTITYDGFSINDNVILGTKTVTFNGISDLKPSWTITAKDTINRADGKTVIWNTERTRTRIDDNGTERVYWDDTFSISGSSNGTNANGTTYSMEIDPINPLIAYANFRHFVKGKVTTTTEKRTAVIDYGDGTRDDIATITINGVTKEIKLRR